MPRRSNRNCFLLALMILSVLVPLRADTWRMEKSGLNTVSADGKDKYLLSVSEIKELVNSGDSEGVRTSLLQLKEDFPEIAGPDLDAFIEAEILFSKGKFVKAARSYEKFLAEYPESDLYEVVLDRQYTSATAFLGGQKKRILGVFKIKGYEEGAKLMEKIVDRSGDAPIAVRAAISVARSYEKRGKFEDAYFQWSLISSQWSTGDTGRMALLGMARTKHACYQGPKYDSSDLISAKSYYENFRLRYVDEAAKLGVDKILNQIDEELAWKEYRIGNYYEKTDNIESSKYYYQMVLDTWPDSEAGLSASENLNNINNPKEKVKK